MEQKNIIKETIKTLVSEVLNEAKNDVSPHQNIGFSINIEKETFKNTNYRKVLYTTPHNQLVVMSLKPKEDIGFEVHKKTAQFIRVESGNGKAIIGEKEYSIKDGFSIIIPAGVKHNIINTSKTDELKLYTVYSPGTHPDGIVEKNKSDEKEEE